jgi:hypothetical protein
LPRADRDVRVAALAGRDTWCIGDARRRPDAASECTNVSIAAVAPASICASVSAIVAAGCASQSAAIDANARSAPELPIVQKNATRWRNGPCNVSQLRTGLDTLQNHTGVPTTTLS